MHILFKTISYGITHIIVATIVAYGLTGNIAVALSIGLIEPIVQTFVFSVHELIWEKKVSFSKCSHDFGFVKKIRTSH
ncbi:MAG: hypothetical protein COV35_05790 [Alphaproteobacteria bacterium CG11_big_fil_rev_8_21_14_0_20_39_49]|nr:MAG: hypothetical protein COV35_05790 [Alphaproteobacteria bacterium CG11_big_fil_rev_8_21_14_0_20_39_49]